MLYGCGAANLDVVCKEYNSTTYICVCPVEQVTYVTVGKAPFPGCPGSLGCGCHTAAEIIAKVNTTNLVACLINGIPEVLGVVVVSVNGTTFNLYITSSFPVNQLTVSLQQQIAAHLGGDFTANEVLVEYTNKKRFDDVNSGHVLVTVKEPVVASAAAYSPFFAIFIVVLTVLF